MGGGDAAHHEGQFWVYSADHQFVPCGPRSRRPICGPIIYFLTSDRKDGDRGQKSFENLIIRTWNRVSFLDV